jgi:hypothetical protein
MIRATVVKVEDGISTIMTEPVIDHKNPNKTIITTIGCEAKKQYSLGQTLEFYLDKKNNVGIRLANAKVDTIDNRKILEHIHNLSETPKKDN